MERYTQRQDDGCAVMDCQSCPVSWINKPNSDCSALYCRNRLKDRLADYEDTGLEPQEIERIQDAYGRGLSLRTESAERLQLIREIPDDRLREIAEAEREGRYAVLPVKVGGTVYRVITTRDCPPLLSEIAIKTVEQAASLIGRMGKHLVISYYPTREAAETALKGEQSG